MRRFFWISGIAAALSVAAWVYVEKVHEPLRTRIEARRYPALPPPGPMGSGIQEDIQKRKAGEVAYRVRRLSQRIAEAERAEGKDLSELKRRLGNASMLASKGYFRDAARSLNVVEARLPIRSEPLRPAGEDDAAEYAPKPPRRSRR